MNGGVKLLLAVLAVIAVLYSVMRWLDPGPRCYDDEQCADLHEQQMEH
jgi:hypothetical protein